MSKFTMWDIDSISIPLAAISVAIKTLISPSLKEFKARWRAACDLLLWIASVRIPTLINFWHNLLALC